MAVMRTELCASYRDDGPAFLGTGEWPHRSSLELRLQAGGKDCREREQMEQAGTGDTASFEQICVVLEKKT